MRKYFKAVSILSLLLFMGVIQAAYDPLPSWKDGVNKRAIIDFVRCVTNKNSKDYVPPKDRFVTIDNDGTLWVEQPEYTQKVFMDQSAKEIAAKKPPFYKRIVKKKNKSQVENEIYAVTNSEITVQDYKAIAKQWLAKARHPRFKRQYTALVYQPMLEVMDYLRKNNFQVYIVSGSGQDFIRAYADKVYGVESNYVIGSASRTDYVNLGKKSFLVKIKQMLFVNDRAVKPETINLFIGKKPLIAFGNSDGDRQMLEWTQSGPGKRLMFLVRHDDAKREYAYGDRSKIGRFSKDLMSRAQKNNWHVISMKDDWKVVFPFEKK